MLLAIRERVMGVVGWVILGIIFIAFAFFGLNSYLGNTNAIYAASVNGVEISPGDENMAYQRLRGRMQEMMGASFNPALINEEKLRADALKQLINDELLYQEGVESGLASSDQQLASQINSIDVFRDNGKFSSQRYERVLANQGMSTGRFEMELRRGIVIDHLRSGILGTSQPTPLQLEQVYRLEGQKRRFNYLVLPVSDFKYQVSVTDEDVSEFYESHNSEYMREQKVKLQYLELDVTSLDTGTIPEEDALRALYQEEVARFTTDEERHARHILVLFQDTSEEQVAAAYRKVDEIIKRLGDGEAFEVLASEFSEDPGSADKGGDLGFFTRGIMVPPFEDAVFNMQIGERSQPVRSAYGLHIIELLDIKEEAVKPYAEVRDSLVDQMLSEERSDRFFEQSEILSNLAFEHPDTLQEAASALGLPIRESDWLTSKGGNGIGENKAVINAAFSDDVLLEGNNSSVIELDEGRIVVFRIAEHQKAEPKPFQEVTSTIRQRIQLIKARELAQARGEELLADLQAGALLEDVAAKQSLKPIRTGLVGRSSPALDSSLIRKAFSMSAPMEGVSSTEGFVMSNGSYAIIQLAEIQDGRIESLDDEKRAQFVSKFARVQGASEMQALMEALESSAKIIIPESDDRL